MSEYRAKSLLELKFAVHNQIRYKEWLLEEMRILKDRIDQMVDVCEKDYGKWAADKLFMPLTTNDQKVYASHLMRAQEREAEKAK